MARRDLDALLAPTAQEQHGVVTRQQVLAHGGTDGAVRHRLDTGRWIRRDSGVYVVAAVPVSWHQQVMVAVLAHDAVASHHTAAVLHGLTGARRRRPEVSVPKGRGHCSRVATIHETRRSIVAGLVGGIRCTSVARTVVDIAADLDQSSLEATIDDGLARGVMRVGSLEHEAAVAVTLPSGGNRRLCQLLVERSDEAWEPPESELERLLGSVLDRRSIPGWRRQAPAPWRPGGAQRVDAFIPAWSLVVEADGRRWHSRLRTLEQDRRRDHAAAAAGLQTLRFGWSELSAESDYVENVLVASGAGRRPWRSS